VTVAGHPKDDLAPGTLNRKLVSFCGKPDLRIKIVTPKYLIVIEKTPNNLSAFTPDLPGCVATGATKAEVEERMRAAIRMHIDGLRQDGLEIPEPSSIAEYIEA
jgi:predicted RNase H-like HicB family nuclease